MNYLMGLPADSHDPNLGALGQGVGASRLVVQARHGVRVETLELFYSPTQEKLSHALGAGKWSARLYVFCLVNVVHCSFVYM